MEYQKLLALMKEINKKILEQPQVDCCSLTAEQKLEVLQNLRELECRQNRILKAHGLIDSI